MRWLAAAAVFLLMALIGHLAVLNAIPSRIMATAQLRMAERGMPTYQWVASPRMTPQTQTIVRPSPDLAYAICRFDISDGPVLLTAPSSDTYGSLSVFDQRTNNVFIARLDGEEDFNGLVIHAPGEKPEAPGGAETLAMPGPGLALIRRLAPDEPTHAAATALVEQSTCELLNARN